MKLIKQWSRGVARPKQLCFVKGNTMNPASVELVTAKALANLLALSTRTIWRMRSAGKLPKPIAIGASIRWRREDVENWLRLNCPDMKTFEHMREGGVK